MAQRYEIEAWVNPQAWDDQDEAQRVIEAIADSGSDSEADWVRIAGGEVADQLDAAARDFDAAEVAGSADTLEGARSAVDAAETRLRALVVDAIGSGMSQVEVAQRSGVSRPTVRRWAGID